MRLPIAGPYRPRARLYLLPDGRLEWIVRLWDVDRPTARVYSTAVLRRYAREQRLGPLQDEIESLLERAREVARRAPG